MEAEQDKRVHFKIESYFQRVTAKPSREGSAKGKDLVLETPNTT